MSFATVAPGQQAELGSAPPICQNCETSTTPLWRRDESGSVLCNACGLFLKLHGRPRPISLKTDIIKSRNRVKPSGPGGQKRKISGYTGQSLAAAHPDIAHGTTTARRPSANLGAQTNSLDARATSPNRSETPQHPPNIAPQHMFDGATFDTHTNYLGESYTAAGQRRASPSTLASGSLQQLDSLAGGGGSQAYAELVAANTSLKTRVSELEVINGFFRERVAELEASEAEARRLLDEALRRDRDSGGDGLGMMNGFQEGGEMEDDVAGEVEEEAGDDERAKRMKMDELLAVDAGEAATASKEATASPVGSKGKRRMRSGNAT